MSSVPGVTVTGTPGASQGSGGVPDTDKPSVPQGPAGAAITLGSNTPSSNVEAPPPVQQPLPSVEPTPSTAVQNINRANEFRPKGTPAREVTASGKIEFVGGGQTQDQKLAQNMIETSNQSGNGNILEASAGPRSQAVGPSQAQLFKTVESLGINYESQTGNLVNGTITTGGPSPRDLYVQTLLSEVAQGYKGQGFKTEESYLSTRLNQVGLAYNPATKTISDPLLIGIIATQKANQAIYDFGSVGGGFGGNPGPSTKLSLSLGGKYGQVGLGYAQSLSYLDKQGNIQTEVVPFATKASEAQRASIYNTKTSEYGNNQDFLVGNINTENSTGSLYALNIGQVNKQQKNVPLTGGPLTPLAISLGSRYGQVALGELVRNSPEEYYTLSSEAARATKYNPPSSLYGNNPILQTPPSKNPTNYTINLKEKLGISESTNNSVIGNVPIELIAKQDLIRTNQNIAIENALGKLEAKTQIENFVTNVSNKGGKEISIYDVKTGANIGQVQANKFGIDVINQIAQNQEIYLRETINPLARASINKQNQVNRDQIVSAIGEAQTLGLKINLINNKTGKTITVPSESGFHSLLATEKGGQSISISKASPSSPQEWLQYTQNYDKLLSTNKNFNVIDFIRGEASGVYNIILGAQAIIISLPENTHKILEKGNPEFYGNNDIFTTIGNVLKPSSFVQNYYNKVSQPESLSSDILSLSIPKESPSYLAGEGSVESVFFVQQAKEAGRYASSLIGKSGTIVKGLVARTALNAAIEGNPFSVYAYEGFGNPNVEGMGIVRANPAKQGIEAMVNPSSLRTLPTFKNLNPMRESIPTDIFSNDNANIPTGSASPIIPRNNTLERLPNETGESLNKLQSSLLTPGNDLNQPAKQRPVSIDIFYKPSSNISRLTGETPPLSDITGTAPTDTTKKPVIPTTPTNPLSTANGILPGTIGNEVLPFGGVGIEEKLSSYQSFIDSLQRPRSTVIAERKYDLSDFLKSTGQKSFDTSIEDMLGLTKKNLVEKKLPIQEDVFYSNKRRSIELPTGETPIEYLANQSSPFGKFESELGRRAQRVKEESKLFDLTGQGALTKSIKETLDLNYKNTIPNKSLGATNKISKNVKRKDIESLFTEEELGKFTTETNELGNILPNKNITKPEAEQERYGLFGSGSKETKALAEKINKESYDYYEYKVKPDLTEFMNIGKSKPRFTETNINLGRGLGFFVSKGKGGLYERPRPPQPPTNTHEEIPKGFKAIESGGTITLQKLEEPKTETITKPLTRKQRKQLENINQNVRLGVGVGTIIKTGTVIKTRSKINQKVKPRYVIIPKQRQKQRSKLIVIPKQEQSQSSKLAELNKQANKESQTFKQQQDQVFKQEQSQLFKQPQTFKQKQEPKLTSILLTAPKLDLAEIPIQTTTQETVPRQTTKLPPGPPLLDFTRRRKNRRKLTKAEKAEFIGNAPENQIEGLYNRAEIKYGLKTVNKLVSKDAARGLKKYHSKINDSFLNKKKKFKL